MLPPTSRIYYLCPNLPFEQPEKVLLEDFHGLRRVLRAAHPLRRVAPCVSQHGVATRVLSEVGRHVVHLNATAARRNTIHICKPASKKVGGRERERGELKRLLFVLGLCGMTSVHNVDGQGSGRAPFACTYTWKYMRTEVAV